MRSYFEQRALLARLETARAETERRIAIIERQITVRAERTRTNTRVKGRQFDRVATTGMRADERDFQANIAALRFGEIDALASKLARQAGAIDALLIRHRTNERAREAVS